MFTEKFVKACRKDYTCEWCGEKVPTGSSIVRISLIFAGDFQSYALHLECHNAMKEYFADPAVDYDDGFDSHSQPRGTSHAEV